MVEMLTNWKKSGAMALKNKGSKKIGNTGGASTRVEDRMTQQLMIEDHGGGLEIEKHSFEEEKKKRIVRQTRWNN